MKIGILTYHRAHNYGAVLQAYALKKYLCAQGHQTEFIDYWPEYRKGMYDLIDFSFFREKSSIVHKLKRLIRMLVVLPERGAKYIKFQNFISSELNVNSISLIKSGIDISHDYDVVFFGSDQIWRYNNFKTFQGFDLVYWGKYPINANVKKIAYAASMGVVSIDEKQQRIIMMNLKNFDSISVRENSLKEKIQSITNKEIEHVLDPVFLLRQNDWLELVKKRESKNKYILFYHLNNSHMAKRLSVLISKHLNCKIVEIRGGVTPFVNRCKVKQHLGPKDFITLIANASYIVSTSFHGVAFSLVFKKQFVALGLGNNSKRVTDLLEALGISNHYIHNLSDFKLDTEIDYNKIDQPLKELHSSSMSFITQNIKKDKL